MTKSDDSLSPIRRQYLEIKAQHPDAIVFFRLGDFYETFDQDAEVTARVLDIVLTERGVGKGQRVPMAGIPHHAAENYMSRLIEQGYHVAICEQVGETPDKGIFPRKVVRIVTPGTVVEPGLLPGDANNYLVAVVIEQHRAGIAYADITTGEFAVTEIESQDILNAVRSEITRLKPAEVLHPDNLQLENHWSGHHSPWAAWRFEGGKCGQVLLSHFKVNTLEGFGINGMPQAVRAAGSIIQYLQDTQPAALNLLTSLNTYSLADFMMLDAATRRNLELTETIRGNAIKGSLLGVLDRTVTPMGKRMLRQWVSKPLLDVKQIQARLDGVNLFFGDGLLRAELRTALKPLGDLERFTNRIVGATAQPATLVQLRTSLKRLPELRELFSGEETALQNILAGFYNCSDALRLLENAIADEPPATLQNTGVIRTGFSAELDGVMQASRYAREWIAGLETAERKRTGIKSLKVGYNKVFGYYIEVTRSNTNMVPEDYIRKQTLVNAERYITPEMKEFESQVLNAEERIKEIERRIFNQVVEQLAGQARFLLATASALAQVDVLAAMAETAALNGYIRPQVVNEDILEIHDGRHPVVEKFLPGSRRFVPNDVLFEEGERVRIITGPNMSGKSTVLRQVALIVLLAQMGSYVPASAARIGLVDRIFTRIGAQDEIHAGQSTFMVEMIETANILNHATPRSLVILDEIGRGTSTYDGVSIAWAMVEFIHNHPSLRSKTLFATHYHELTQLAEILPGVRNFNVAVSEADGRVVFLHKIVAGGADRSYGIHVAELAGLPRPVIQRANEILHQLEASSGNTVKHNPIAAQQLALFPDTNPLLEEIKYIDVNSISPIEALNKLYEWQKKYLK